MKLRTLTGWHIREETPEQQQRARRYNPALQVWHKTGRTPGKTVAEYEVYPCSAGRADTVGVFYASDLSAVFIVAVNYALNYAGIQAYDQQSGELIGELFEQSEPELLIGQNWQDVSLLTVCKRLASYLD